ncbi:hypothetical protein A6A27_36710 [Micromonospora sp. CB01531]|nr:hypothetical protein A6A27_36710 [Micromonospora sp. CB01531]
MSEGRAAGVVMPLGVAAGGLMNCSSRPLGGDALITSDSSVSTTSGRTVASTTGLFGNGAGWAWAASATRDAPAAATPSAIARSQSLTWSILAQMRLASSTLHGSPDMR